MAEGATTLCTNYLRAMMNKEVNEDTDTFRLVLLTGYGTPSKDGAPTYADIDDYECSGDGYTAGGMLIPNPTITQDDATNEVRMDGDNVVMPGLDVGQPSHAAIINDTHASKIVKGFIELGRWSNGGQYEVRFHDDGILALTN